METKSFTLTENGRLESLSSAAPSAGWVKDDVARRALRLQLGHLRSVDVQRGVVRRFREVEIGDYDRRNARRPDVGHCRIAR